MKNKPTLPVPSVEALASQPLPTGGTAISDVEKALKSWREA